MGVIRDIDKLGSVIKPLCRAMLAKLDKAGIRYVVLETLRTYEVARAYWLQGRAPLTEVNEARKSAGLYLLSEAENKRTVTRLNPDIKQSKHMTGDAFDLAPLKSDGRTIDWSAPKDVWLKIGEIGESCGLSWGGRWGQTAAALGWDCPHFEV